MDDWHRDGFEKMLLRELRIREPMSAREMSLAAGLHHGSVSAILGGKRPDAETCSKLALYLGRPEMELLWLAGRIKTPPDMDDVARAIAAQIEDLPRSEVDRLLDLIRAFVRQS